MAGMHGCYAANMGLTECDLLINIGARFDDRLTGNLQHFAPHATVAHIDIDPAEIGKNVPTSIPIVADAKENRRPIKNGWKPSWGGRRNIHISMIKSLDD
jgi:acetolactate synthase-1/2/3 large subunit